MWINYITRFSHPTHTALHRNTYAGMKTAWGRPSALPCDRSAAVRQERATKTGATAQIQKFHNATIKMGFIFIYIFIISISNNFVGISGGRGCGSMEERGVSYRKQWIRRNQNTVQHGVQQVENVCSSASKNTSRLLQIHTSCAIAKFLPSWWDPKVTHSEGKNSYKREQETREKRLSLDQPFPKRTQKTRYIRIKHSHARLCLNDT